MLVYLLVNKQLDQLNMKHTVTTKIVLNHRFQRKDGTHSLALRVTYLREARLFTISEINLDKADFEKIQKGKARGDLKEIQLKLNAIETRAKGIIEKIVPFSFEIFKNQFEGKEEFQKQVIENDVFVYFVQKIAQLKAEKRLGTASSYQCSVNSLKAFTGRDKMGFQEINVNFLKNYERFMVQNGSSLTTVGIYLRNVRTIYNSAISEKLVDSDNKPFGRGKYVIPSGKNIKKALTKSDVEKISNYPVREDSTEYFARDMWYFSYLSNGMNVKDIALLKNQNIQRNKIIFQRAKTAKSTRSNPKFITVILQEPQLQIIHKWRNKDTREEAFLFPFLTENMSAEEERKTIQQKTKTINKYMKRIGEALSLDLKLTTYVARHSFATVLKRGGAPIEVISEMMGHTDLKTTENYLDSFSDEALSDYAKLLR